MSFSNQLEHKQRHAMPKYKIIVLNRGQIDLISPPKLTTRTGFNANLICLKEMAIFLTLN